MTRTRPLWTLDPLAPLDDLEWLDEAVGDARVVAIGESAHYNRECFQLRHRILRYLVERHHFTAYLQESGFVEGWLVNDWVRGGRGGLGQVMAQGLTSLMGLWAQMRAQLEWMRDHNGSAGHLVGFCGIDLPGSMVSLLPGLDAVIAYLAQAEPELMLDPNIRQTAATFASTSAFSAPATIEAYAKSAAERRDALTASLADLTARMRARRLDYIHRTTLDAYERACRCLEVTVALDALGRALARGDRHEMMLVRDATIAETVAWILRREARVVLGAHNGHVQRSPAALPGMAPAATMGMDLADRLGHGYLVIGTTSGRGQTLNTDPTFYSGELFTEMGPPETGSLDALMAASYDGPFATDLRRLSPPDAAAVRAAHRLRYGTYYADLDPLEAFDVVIHLPQVTSADPDPDALAQSPEDVRKAFARNADR
jgi:erythromycin esterase